MSKLRALLVGAGGMGRAWARNLHAHPAVELVAWVDLRPDVAIAAAAELGLATIHIAADLGAAIAATQPDFVVDVSVPEAHHAVTLQALAAGVPVLGEKPMATSLEEAREMVAAAERAGRLYMVSQSRRYDSRLFAFRELIRQQIGPLGILNADFYIGAHFGGFRDAMNSPLVLDMAIHTFDQARFLCDADPLAVYCEEWNPPWSWYRGAACATAIFEMRGGLRFTYRGSWCAEGQPTSWESAWRAVGPRGTATWDGTSAPLAEVVVGDEGFQRPVAPRTIEPDTGMATGIAGSLNDFLHALQHGTTPMGECHDNIKSLAMVFGAIESARTGQRVPIKVYE